MKFTDRFLNAALTGASGIAKKRAAPADPEKTLREGVFDRWTGPVGDRWSAGFARRVIMPDDVDTAAYYIAGYRENNPARGVLDPQNVCALWLDDLTGRGGTLLLAFDAVGILQRDVLGIRAALGNFRVYTGCREITVCCTHNHAGIDTMGLWGPLPRTGKNKKFMALLTAKAKEAAFAAYRDRREGRLFHGSVEVPDMQEDIRTPEVYSRTLTRLRFQPEDGTREVWLLNFAAHSESLQGCNSLISADHPCYLRERIRSETGAETVYTVGAVGGMISMKLEDEPLLRREHRLPESTRAIGYKLAGYAMSVKDDAPLPARLDYIRQPFFIPAENRLLTLAGLAGIIGVDRWVLPSGEAAIRTELTYMELGNLPLLFLPGELFPELAYGGALPAEASATGEGPESNPPALTETAGDNRLVIVGLANDEIGYILPPNDFYLHPQKPYLEKGVDRFGRRHYEETNSVGPAAAAAISEALRRAMEKVRESAKLPVVSGQK